jgi:hypothetical protein
MDYTVSKSVMKMPKYIYQQLEYGTITKAVKDIHWAPSRVLVRFYGVFTQYGPQYVQFGFFRAPIRRVGAVPHTLTPGRDVKTDVAMKLISRDVQLRTTHRP